MKMPYLIAAGTAGAFLALMPAASAQAAPGHHGHICLRQGHGRRCLTLGKGSFSLGHGSPVTIRRIGRVHDGWPFRTDYLDYSMKKEPVLQIRYGRRCLRGYQDGTVRLARCSAASRWVLDSQYYPGLYAAVRPSDQHEQAQYLSAGSLRMGSLVSALPLNGYQILRQEWRRP